MEEVKEDVDKKKLLDRLVENLKTYLELRLRYYKLLAYEKGAQMITFLIAGFIFVGFFLIFYILINITIGFMLADFINSLAGGFGIVAGFNFLVAVVIVVFRKKLILNPLINATIGMIMQNEEDETE